MICNYKGGAVQVKVIMPLVLSRVTCVELTELNLFALHGWSIMKRT
jgi:hypothetical protein